MRVIILCRWYKNHKVVLYDLVTDRFGQRPYGWHDWETVLLVVRRGEGDDDGGGDIDFSASSISITTPVEPDTLIPLIVPGTIGPNTIVIE